MKAILSRLNYAVSRAAEALVIKAAWLLPRRLAYWCAIRVGAHATTGRWSSQEVPSLTLGEALKRWDTR